MKDKYIKRISVFSIIELVLTFILLLSIFYYMVGAQGGDYLLHNKLLNVLVMVLLAVLLTAIWIIKLVLKRKRRKFLIEHDKP